MDGTVMVVRRCGEGNGRVDIDASFGQKIVPRLRNNTIFRHTRTAPAPLRRARATITRGAVSRDIAKPIQLHPAADDPAMRDKDSSAF